LKKVQKGAGGDALTRGEKSQAGEAVHEGSPGETSKGQKRNSPNNAKRQKSRMLKVREKKTVTHAHQKAAAVASTTADEGRAGKGRGGKRGVACCPGRKDKERPFWELGTQFSITKKRNLYGMKGVVYKRETIAYLEGIKCQKKHQRKTKARSFKETKGRPIFG